MREVEKIAICDALYTALTGVLIVGTVLYVVFTEIVSHS